MIAPHECPAAGPAARLAASIAQRIPQIDTPRLRLRAPRIEDFATYARIACSARGRFLQADADRETAWADFCMMVATWPLRGHGAWTVEERDTATVAGFVLIGFEPGDREPELGFLLTEAAEGRGLGAEAAQAARAFALDRLGLSSLVSYVDPGNTRATRLAERLGAARDTVAEAAFPFDIQVFRHAPESRP